MSDDDEQDWTRTDPEPRTEAGRLLLGQEAFNHRAFPLITVEMVRAVEDEAERLAAMDRDIIADGEALSLGALLGDARYRGYVVLDPTKCGKCGGLANLAPFQCVKHPQPSAGDKAEAPTSDYLSASEQRRLRCVCGHGLIRHTEYGCIDCGTSEASTPMHAFVRTSGVGHKAEAPLDE